MDNEKTGLIPIRKVRKYRNCRDLILKRSPTHPEGIPKRIQMWETQVPLTNLKLSLNINPIKITGDDPQGHHYTIAISDGLIHGFASYGRYDNRDIPVMLKLGDLRKLRKLSQDQLSKLKTLWVKGLFAFIPTSFSKAAEDYFYKEHLTDIFFDQKPICQRKR